MSYYSEIAEPLTAEQKAIRAELVHFAVANFNRYGVIEPAVLCRTIAEWLLAQGHFPRGGHCAAGVTRAQYDHAQMAWKAVEDFIDEYGEAAYSDDYGPDGDVIRNPDTAWTYRIHREWDKIWSGK
jgi:hypothetical protein